MGFLLAAVYMTAIYLTPGILLWIKFKSFEAAKPNLAVWLVSMSTLAVAFGLTFLLDY